MVENSKTESTEIKKIPLACTILANVALPIVVSRLHYHFYVSRQQNSLSKSIACQIYRYIKIVPMSKQDKVNSADSAFILLII